MAVESAVGARAPARPHATIGLAAMTALVVGSMIGGGVFSLPQNMAAEAAPGPILIGWGITGVGILALAFVYIGLSRRKPDLDSGPYAYARAGFGDFVGFNAAWGYWLSAWLGNVSYAVLIFGTLGHFFPLFGAGNTLPAVICASVVVWAVHALVLAGVREAALTNLVTTLAKLVPILIFIAVLLTAFQWETFVSGFWGAEPMTFGSVTDQVRATMLVTLWVFIGIEGASVESARAARRSDIGRATLAGFLVALIAYLGVSLLSQGVLRQADLAALPDTASMANVLGSVVGPWGDTLIRAGLMISVGGAFLAWTLFAAEIPFVAAREGILPKLLSRTNPRQAPAASLWITNGLVQLFLIVTLISESTYTALFYIASTAILVPYVLSGAYALKLAWSGEGYAKAEGRGRDIVIGAIATLYGAWLVYAAGPAYLLMCALLYAAGLPVYWLARREAGARPFTAAEAALAGLIFVAALAAAWLMWTGAINPL